MKEAYCKTLSVWLNIQEGSNTLSQIANPLLRVEMFDIVTLLWNLELKLEYDRITLIECDAGKSEINCDQRQTENNVRTMKEDNQVMEEKE